MLDEMERSIHDSLSIVKWTLESNMVVAGGGAAEAALSVYLENCVLITTMLRQSLISSTFLGMSPRDLGKCYHYVNSKFTQDFQRMLQQYAWRGLYHQLAHYLGF